MGLIKHGVGDVLPDDEGKTAATAPAPTDQDRQALAKENAEADGGSSDDAG